MFDVILVIDNFLQSLLVISGEFLNIFKSAAYF